MTTKTININGIIIPASLAIEGLDKIGFSVKERVVRTVADYDPIDIENGKKFLAIRKAHKLTQKEFARLVGYSAAHVSAVERGYYRATGVYMDRVHKEFDRKPSIDFKAVQKVSEKARSRACRSLRVRGHRRTPRRP